MIIETEKELKFENVLSLRKKMTQMRIQEEMLKIQEFLKQHNLAENGPVTTATYAIDQNGGNPILDMELLIPLSKEFESSGDYVFKKLFHLVNAVCIHHEGNPALLQNTYNELNSYIMHNHMQPITAGYNVTVREPKPGESIDSFKADVYIGINPSVL